MRIRKRLAAVAAAGCGAHHQLLQQSFPGSPLSLPSTRQPVSAVALTSGTAHQLHSSTAHQLHVSIQEGRSSSTSPSHVGAQQQQVLQTRDHAQRSLFVSHDNGLAASTSEKDFTDLCGAVAGLEHPSQHGASHTVSSSGAKRADRTHGESSSLAAACSSIVEAVDAVQECDMAFCASPNKALRRLYTDNAPWQRGRSRLEVGDNNMQNACLASLAHGQSESLCLEHKSSNGESTVAHAKKKPAASISTEPCRSIYSKGPWQTSFSPTRCAGDDADGADRDVHMLTTARTITQLPKNLAPTSPSILKDYAKWPEQMLYDEESGGLSCRAQGDNKDRNLQTLARDLIRNNVNAGVSASTSNDGKVFKLGILSETRHNLKKNNVRIDGNKVDSDIVYDNKKKNNQDRVGDQHDRCCRRSGRGWQCKNLRAASGSSIYCHYHQLKVSKNHASWNARNKSMKENKRNRQSIEPEASIQPLQNKMVDVKMVEFPLLPSKQYMYENVQAHDAISSEVGAIFMKRLSQAAGGMEKQPFFNSGSDYYSKKSQNSTTFSSLAETVVPSIKFCTHSAEESNSESQASGSFSSKRRRIDTGAKIDQFNLAVDGYPGCSLSSSNVKNGVDNVSVNKINDLNAWCGAYKEPVHQKFLRCKRKDGKGWRCGKICAPNSLYCCYHQMKLSKYRQKRSLKARSQYSQFLPDTNASAKVQITSAEDVHSMINHRDNYMEASPRIDCGAVGVSVDEDGVHNEKNENEHHEEKKLGYADCEVGECKRHRGMQDESAEHGKFDRNVAQTGVHFRQLQQEQLRWWEDKQGGKEGTVISEMLNSGKQAEVPMLPRRSERRLIIDVCRSTAAEHEQTKDKVDAFDNEWSQPMSSRKASGCDELLQQETSCTAFNEASAKPQTPKIEPINMENAHQIQNNDSRQCKRNDGRGWQCKRMCADGRFYCDYHLMKLRHYVERTGEKLKDKLLRRMQANDAVQLQKQMHKSEDDTKLELQTVVAEKVEHKQEASKGSCKARNEKPEGATNNAAKRESVDDATDGMEQRVQTAGGAKRKMGSKEPQSCFKEAQQPEQLAIFGAELPEQGEAADGKQSRRCGRHDGRGWQCKSMCKEGSLYCEYHRDKLRKNHETWNAKKLQEKLKAKSLAIRAAGEGPKREEGALVQVDQQEMVPATAVKQSPAKSKKMRSWQDIEARL